MVKLNDRLNATFAALSDGTRRSLLNRLKRGPCTVNELAEPFEISLAAISKHLKVLERANLVRRKRSGRQMIFSLSVKPMSEAEKWLQSYRKFWEASLDRLEDYVDKKHTGDR